MLEQLALRHYRTLSAAALPMLAENATAQDVFVSDCSVTVLQRLHAAFRTGKTLLSVFACMPTLASILYVIV